MKSKILLPFILLSVAFFHSAQLKTPPSVKPYTVIAAQTIHKQAKNSDDIKSYILSRAKAENVSTTIVSWIVEHESQWGRRMVGDDGKSLGIWMIDRQYHPNISEQCADSMTCSTRVSLEWLKQGKQDMWSTWRLRCSLYPKENPPGCKKG